MFSQSAARRLLKTPDNLHLHGTQYPSLFYSEYSFGGEFRNSNSPIQVGEMKKDRLQEIRKARSINFCLRNYRKCNTLFYIDIKSNESVIMRKV